MKRRNGMTLVDLAVMVNLGFIGFLFLVVVTVPMGCRGGRGRAIQTKCGNNLKQIGLAAIQYADDKRFFPHIAPIKSLDGGWQSDTASRVARALINQGYHDDHEAFVCPSSPDQYVPITKAARENMRAFRWGGKDGAPDAPSPLVKAHETDRPLDEMTELSYGWTRRGYSPNSHSANLLAGDKSRSQARDDVPQPGTAHVGNMAGNHKDAMLAVCVDGHTIRLTPNGDQITTRTIGETTGPGAGFLGVLGDDPESAR